MAKWLRKILTFIIMAALCLGITLPVFAVPGVVVKVAVSDYPNYLSFDDGNNVSGYAYEYLQRISQYTHWQYEFIPMTFEESMLALEKGTIDLVPGVQSTEKRKKIYDFSTLYIGSGTTILCTNLKNNKYYFNDFGDYNGMKIAALQGSIRGEQTRKFLEAYGTKVDMVYYPSDAECKVALSEGKVDAILMSSIRSEKNLKILAYIQRTPLYFCLDKNKPFLKQELDIAMNQIRMESPYYEAQLDKIYFGHLAMTLSFTQAEREFIQNSKVINVAISEGQPPIEYYDPKSKEFKGVVVDMYNKISEDSGLIFHFVPRQNISKITEQMRNGQVGLIGMVANAGAAANTLGVKLSDTIYTTNLYMVANKQVKDYKDSNCKVALCNKYPLFQNIAKDKKYVKFLYFNTPDECVAAVNEGKADLTMLFGSALPSLIDSANYENIVAYVISGNEYRFSVGIPGTASPYLQSVINKAIRGISDDERRDIMLRNMNEGKKQKNFKDIIGRYRGRIAFVILLLAIIVSALAFNLVKIRAKNAEMMLKQAKKDKEANQLKTDFLTRMNHDLRTPLNAILGLTYIMEGEEKLPDIKAELPKLRESGEYLLQLINDILTVTKMEHGKFVLHPRPVAMKSFFRNIIDIMNPALSAKEIDFHFSQDNDNDKNVLADNVHLKEVFLNLLNNAVKFTPEGGRIDLIKEKIAEKADLVSYKFTVRDTGCGMSAEFLPHIFEPFNQENRVNTDKAGGTGLGLTIIKQLIALMDGKIEIHSQIDKGTEVIINLTFPESDLPEETTEQSQVHNYPQLHGKKVLYCEDNPINALIVKKLLAGQECQVVVAVNGKVGLETFAASHPGEYNAILMDVRMPVMNGLDTAKAIRSLARTDAKKIGIIAMSANAFEEDIKLSKASGMNEHLSKPVKPQELYEALNKVI